MLDFDALLEQMWSSRATDMILTVGASPGLRLSGELREISSLDKVTSDDVVEVARRLLKPLQFDQFMNGTEVDFSFSHGTDARVRGNIFQQLDEPTMALRMIPTEIPSLEDLGVPQAVREITKLKKGLMLVTGATGSGKSTSLAAMVDEINRTRACHIVTIEDPIEYIHSRKTSFITQREVGKDTESFTAALKNVLRQNPDVIMVGELRDLESIQFALTLAETGHLVLSTLHTNDTAQAIDRLIDVFPGNEQAQIRVQLASALTAVVYQRLIPRSAGTGLVAAYEVLMANAAARNLIREGKTAQLPNQLLNRSNGNQTFEHALNGLISQGFIDRQTALDFATRPKELMS